MNNQESSHLVDECVISPLQSSLEVNFEDSVARVGLRRFWSFESALWLCYFVRFIKDKKKRWIKGSHRKPSSKADFLNELRHKMKYFRYLSNTQGRFSTYVSHKVAEIVVSNSDVKEMHHIPGEINVADNCTRGKEIEQSALWSEPSSLVYQFATSTATNLIRGGGRVNKASFPYEAKHQDLHAFLFVKIIGSGHPGKAVPRGKGSSR